jgi:CBS domain-containing protein
VGPKEVRKMKVRDVYTPDVVTASTGESLGIAASRMDYHAVGALLVKDEFETVGIITERDLLHAVAEDRDLDGTSVVELMTEGFVPVKIDADVGEAAGLMVTLGARHLPVSDHGEIVGMVSARDLLAVKAWEGLAEILEKDVQAVERWLAG